MGNEMNTKGPMLMLTAHLLEPAEREVVLGDLTESRASPLHALCQVLNLGVRRHIALWLQWRPWLSGPGLALPGSFFLMGVSLSVSQACLQLIDSGASTDVTLTRLLAQRWWTPSPWLLDCVMTWPAVYLAVVARIRQSKEESVC